MHSDLLFPLFDDFFRPLQRGKYLEAYRVLGDHYVITIDGSGYFSSEAIGCPSCLRKTTKGRTLFEHWIVQAALVHPNKRQVIPLAPEEVRNTDGTEKQDCEIKAAKTPYHETPPVPSSSETIVVADSLYSKQPFIEALSKEDMHYVLVAKDEDHKILMEYVEGDAEAAKSHPVSR